MKAARWYNIKDIRVDDIPKPQINPDEALVRVKWCGICGSDLHEYVAGPINVPATKPHPITGEVAPITLGHEYSGIIAEVGSNITHLKVGDKVCVEPVIFCGECRSCREGNTNACIKLGFQGLSGFGGGFSEYTKFRADKIYKLPDSMSLEDGALIEPLAVAYHSLEKGQFKKGQVAIVSGAGTIGLSTIKVLKAMGASKIFVVQRESIRQQYARNEGVDVLDPYKVDVIAEITRLTNGEMADVAFETTGSQICFDLLLGSLKATGYLVNTSLWEEPAIVNMNSVVFTEKNIVGTICYHGNDFPEVISLVDQGKIITDGLITKKARLADIVDDGFEILTGPEKKKHVKILITPDLDLI
ncbi:MAG: butanediol dehydrogenase [Candidatus Epulonipiscioides saccharophilum]|nr:MAG: butanediol dehydrogenase [Epulopiscium sp. AS2M-Bin001]